MRKKEILCHICAVTAKVHFEDQNEDAYQKKGREGKLCCPQEVSVLSAVGKQTRRVSVLKCCTVSEMPHMCAKRKYGFKATDWQHQSQCTKPQIWLKPWQRPQKPRAASAHDAVQTERQIRTMGYLSFSAFLHS